MKDVCFKKEAMRMQMMFDMKSEGEERRVDLEVESIEDIRPLVDALPEGVVISLDMEEVLGYGQKTE
jgi:hypothetical protein